MQLLVSHFPEKDEMQQSHPKTHLFLFVPTSLSEELVYLHSVPLFMATAALNSDVEKAKG